MSSLAGLTWKDLEKGLGAFRSQRRSSAKLTQWLTPQGTSDMASCPAGDAAEAVDEVIGAAQRPLKTHPKAAF